jgi:hypothetical protein
MLTNKHSQYSNIQRKLTVYYSIWSMATGTSTFVLRPRVSGFKSPGFVYSDVEDPGALANPDEHIPYIAPYGIRRNPIWSTTITRWDGYPCDI